MNFLQSGYIWLMAASYPPDAGAWQGFIRAAELYEGRERR
jgi:hypothetical protein